MSTTLSKKTTGQPDAPSILFSLFIKALWAKITPCEGSSKCKRALFVIGAWISSLAALWVAWELLVFLNSILHPIGEWAKSALQMEEKENYLTFAISTIIIALIGGCLGNALTFKIVRLITGKNDDYFSFGEESLALLPFYWLITSIVISILGTSFALFSVLILPLIPGCVIIYPSYYFYQLSYRFFPEQGAVEEVGEEAEGTKE